MEPLLTSKMPSEAPVYPTQPEKPHHYTYLKEFRTQQCPLFLQHKCTQHRPFTCFHWHFLNQRRRRPVRRRDGTFNYSPDAYCTKYDETTGICPEGDDCQSLHRTAGDTERRYHLRYYKTGNCVHETDSKGHCVKNGPHCAFAHGALDLRQPVYDIRELASGEVCDNKGALESCAATQLEKDIKANEDPKWNDTNYVLANYKTEQCKRPPRLCRQGYACPSYHNSRDRRRSPKKHKYRSTPCPNVKHGDDWGDPAQCDSGDSCQYCHTRTEQQFHPEIYKSTKCNDMVQTGYCPRGPFCAFAHVEQEMTTQRELSTTMDNSLAAFVTNALPPSMKDECKDDVCHKMNGNGHDMKRDGFPHIGSPAALPAHRGSLDNGMVGSLPEPIGRHRSASGGSALSNSFSTLMQEMLPPYQRAPGSEREDAHLRQQLQSLDDDPNLDHHEKNKRKQTLFLMHHNLSSSLPGTSSGSSSSTLASTMSPHAPSFYPAGDTVESVIGNALEEDLGELSLSSIERDLAKENDNDANSVCSSYSAGFNATNYFGPSSLPVTIPSSSGMARNVASLSQSPVSSPLGSLPNSFLALQQQQQQQQQQKQEQQLHDAALAFLSQPNPGKYSAPGYPEYNSMSPRSGSISQSPLLASGFGLNGFSEVQRLQAELAANKAKMAQWEEGISQARSACEAWKKEAEESTRKAKIAEDDRQQAIKQRDEAVSQVAKLTQEMDHLRGGPFIHCLQRVTDLETMPVNIIKQMQAQLRMDLDTLEKVMFHHRGVKCLVCHERKQNIAALPCNHYVICEPCVNKQITCPVCHMQIRRSSALSM